MNFNHVGMKKYKQNKIRLKLIHYEHKFKTIHIFVA